MLLGILPWYFLSDLKFMADMGLLLVEIMLINMVLSLVVLPLLVPMVRMLAFKLTLEELAPVREAMDWLAPRLKLELPLPLASMVTAVRPLAVGRAFVTFALRMPPLRMKVGPL